jgi:dTDP-4-dehydrorhamnose 3,5-epimerase
MKNKPILYKIKYFKDTRGAFFEIYLKKKFNFKCNFTAISVSKKNTIRGFHYQIKKPQIKFITLLKGRALDVCINIDKKSKDFGKIYKFTLQPGMMLLIPKTFAHAIGFYEKNNILLYHLSEYRHARYERGIAYNDKLLNIKWKIKNPILSERDKCHPSFKKIKF